MEWGEVYSKGEPLHPSDQERSHGMVGESAFWSQRPGLEFALPLTNALLPSGLLSQLLNEDTDSHLT